MAQVSSYTPEDGETICEALAEGHSLLSICEAMGISFSTASDWEDNVPQHGENSAQARARGCHVLAQQCLQIADDDARDWEPLKDADGNVTGIRVDGEHVTRAKLRIDTRMRLIGKWLPKVYGEKVTQEHTGADGGAIKTESTMSMAGLTTEQVRAIASIAVNPG